MKRIELIAARILAHKWAGYPNKGRLRGLLKPAQAGLVGLARPFTGWAWSLGKTFRNIPSFRRPYLVWYTATQFP